jgi:hypothetical protein
MLLSAVLLLLCSVAGLPGARGEQGRTLLAAAPSLPLDTIRLPPGFRVELYVNFTVPTRFLALGRADSKAGTNTVYVSSTDAGVVSATTAGAAPVCTFCLLPFAFFELTPPGRLPLCTLAGTHPICHPPLLCMCHLQVTALVGRGGGSPVEACTLLSGLDNPNGVAYDPSTGSLYVAEVTKITRHDGADAAALAGCDASLLHSTQVVGPEVLPNQGGHANRFLGINSRDSKLYVTVALPSNVDVCEDPYCTIHRMDKDGKNVEIFARGGGGACGGLAGLGRAGRVCSRLALLQLLVSGSSRAP